MASDHKHSSPGGEPVKAANFLRAVIERDLDTGTYAARHFAGSPGDAAHQMQGPIDPAGSARASRPSPTAICTSATPRASA